MSDILATKPDQSKYCPDLNSTEFPNGTSDNNDSQFSNLINATELENLISEVCAYRIAYAKYGDWLTRREQQITASENYQSNVLTIVSVVIALVTLALGAGSWFFSATIANNEVKVKNAQQELKKTQKQMGKAKQEMVGVQQEIKKAQEKFVDFQKFEQMQIDCEMELLKILRENGFEDYIVASLMIELRIYLPLLASGDEARIKSAARFLGSYTTGYDLPKLAEYALYCRSKTPQELHYLFNFALPENEQI